MQGQRSGIESLPETFERGRGTTMNNPGMDQQVYWNEFLDPVDTQSSEGYLLSPNDTNMSYANATTEENSSLNIWNSSAPSSSEQPQNLDNRDEAKMEHMWTTSETSNGGDGLRTEERRFEETDMLSLESVNINRSNHHTDNSQPFSHSSNSIDFPQNSDRNVAYGSTSIPAPESGLYPHYNSGGLGSGHVISSGGSSGGIFSEEGEVRPGGSVDGWRSSCKRKNTEGVSQQASGSSSLFRQSESSSINSVSSDYNQTAMLNTSRSSQFLSGLSPPGQLNSRSGTSVGVVISDSRNAESSRRNFRIRLDPAQQHDMTPPSLWVPGNTTTISNVSSTSQPVSLPIPFTESLASGPVVAGASSQNQLHRPATTRLPRYVLPRSGASSSGLGGSLSNPIIVGERVTASREETHSRSVLRSNTTDSSAFLVAPDTRQSIPLLPHEIFHNGSAGVPENVAPTSLTGNNSEARQPPARQPPVPYLVPQQNPPEYTTIPESVRQLLFPPGSSASRRQSVDTDAPGPVQSATSQDIWRPSAAGSRGQRLAFIRSQIMLDRQRDGVPGLVSGRTLATSREGRNRMISQIRDAIDLMRRGENMPPEDAFIYDRYGWGSADLTDRHRDMRLDVDNMSYEELLALEERIGDVKTGLSEETVMKNLKQRKHASVTVEASAEVEPCCVCQEEYIDGEDLGYVDCGHQFHSACIKQWLMQKNICPICKTTALSTT